MHELLQFLAKYGYWLLFACVIARQACLPVPANLLLLAAGALAGSGKLNLAGIIIVPVLGFLCADLAWFEAGRRWGTKILHFACGISGDPSACVRKANTSFTRYGVKSLLLSKFVPGLDAVAAPLVGASPTTRGRFLVFDGLGALLWAGVYATLGYVFSEQLDRVVAYASQAGEFLGILFVIALSFYVARKIFLWMRFLREYRLARITPDQLRDKITAGENVFIVDVQRHGRAVRELITIPGAVRIDPSHIDNYQTELEEAKTPENREVVLYCTCPSEYTSARLALTLQRRGFRRVRPLAGGLQAWRDRGFAVTELAIVTPQA
jgi:membrane protein DedA with SNARE-associated domain/rhodanese-related sulfurtransferase